MRPQTKNLLICLLSLAILAALLWTGNRGSRARLKSAKAQTSTSFHERHAAIEQAETVEAAIQTESKENYSEQLAAIHSLEADLEPEQIGDLYAFLRRTDCPEGVKASDMHVLKNDIMNALYNQGVPPADLGRIMMEIYRDKKQDAVTRDYALQHLTGSYEKAPVEQKAEIKQILLEALDEKQSSIAGTALLGLSRLGIEEEKLRQTALKLAQDRNSGDVTRITAFQICARMKTREALPSALELAKNSQSVPLQIAAIATIGSVGSKQEISFLETLAEDPKSRLQPAAKSALERLKMANARTKGKHVEEVKG